jgi:colanic acid/amylovoran biosynthesis glycosyltransferase
MIAYVTQAFPVATETFTYDEVRGLLSHGRDVRVHALRRAGPLDWDVSEIPFVILPQSPVPLAVATVRAAVAHPARFLRSLAWALQAGVGARGASLRGRLANLAALPRGAALAAASDASLFHAQFANEAATAAMIAAHLTGARFSFRSHTSPSPRLLATKLHRAALVLAISEHDRGVLLQSEPRARVEVSRLGVAVPTDQPLRERQLIVSVGSLIEKKGHHNLVAACRVLAERGVPFRCEILGEGWMRNRLAAQIADAGLGDRVVLRGHLDRAETLDLLARATVATLAPVPSSTEGDDGIPVALIEALARGTAVVSSRISGIPELVVDGRTGLLVQPNDVSALADAMERLLGDPALARRLGDAGRVHVASEYDPEQCFGRAARLLGDAAGDRVERPI